MNNRNNLYLVKVIMIITIVTFTLLNISCDTTEEVFEPKASEELEKEIFELKIPEELKKEIVEGIPSYHYVFYTCKNNLPISWNDFREHGLWFGPERPPLVRKKYQLIEIMVEAVDWMSEMTGEADPMVTVKFSSQENAEVPERALGYPLVANLYTTEPKINFFDAYPLLDVIMTENVNFERSLRVAKEYVKEKPGLILLTNKNVEFKDEEEMIQVVFR